VIERLRVTPVSRLAILAGRVLRDVVMLLTTIMLEGILVALGLAVACLWIAGRAFVRENA
jgi:ABC-2 type transport system permease protein